jgi:hypothetical protein
MLSVNLSVDLWAPEPIAGGELRIVTEVSRAFYMPFPPCIDLDLLTADEVDDLDPRYGLYQELLSQLPQDFDCFTVKSVWYNMHKLEFRAFSAKRFESPAEAVSAAKFLTTFRDFREWLLDPMPKPK